MNKFYFTLVLILNLFSIPVYANSDVKPFKTDVCTSSPNGTWGHCCIEHDIAYWRGGTKSDRKRADHRLRWCMIKSGGPGKLYYDFVRAAGWAYWGKAWCDTLAESKPMTEEQMKSEIQTWKSLDFSTTMEGEAIKAYTCFFSLNDQDNETLDSAFNYYKMTNEYQTYRQDYAQVVGEDPWY